MTNQIPTSDARVELLVWSGCPSHERAEGMLRQALADIGRGEHPVLVRWIESDEAAEAERFAGSPTFRLDGADLVDPGQRFGLTCRLYTRDGRPSPLPSQETLTDWLRAGIALLGM